MNENKKEIRKIYNLLYGMYIAAKEQRMEFIFKNDIEQFNYLLDKLLNLTGDEYFKMYKVEKNDYYNERTCRKEIYLIKILPMVEYIKNEYIETTEETIQKVGALYNSIEDTELQKRCGDILLESSGAFDRVINQATQILEDRIKKKSGLQETTLIGLSLVSKAIHSRLDLTILKFSDNADIQEKYAALFKGIIGVYRNPTHHGLDYECSREDALKFCAYIDLLLKEVEKSEKII
ncbi:MAG: TIGR02391 family protein [Clostridia bacterium]